ncbi:putative nucleic acid-binding Zn ribbon protein [Saccharothrix tamanrassetensis]|uniref:Putative nucleic acid-binding Zn ribbon protein n=1 Tax=Saccharothrix tamanrassetensis TaxID=1051531 RepID=A0A841CQ51_9PSEU|nr:zinc-ribbon domain-containing protein [Saccharothrix tamanrassetensis]MBB5958258.1 putative nucleic acid-binding Zn ribbon protein [Saccharothrix tamanrassetensis]
MTARSCPQCGAAVGDSDDFCGNCGNYLGWGGGALVGRSDGGVAAGGSGGGALGGRSSGVAGGAPVGRSESAAGGVADGTPVGRTDGGAAGGVAADGSAGGAPAERSEGAAGSVASGSAAGRPVGGEGRSTGYVDGPVRDRASGYLGPVPPGRPDAKRPLPTTTADVAVDGPPCPNCGTANPPGRRFCRRCATPLHPGETAASAARRRKWRWRGDRSRWLRRLVALLVVAALVVAAWLFHPKAFELWEDLRDRLATPAPATPTGVTANAAVPGHPAGAAADGLSNRYWGAPAVGDEVEFTFAAPFRLLSVVVHAGASAEEEGFAAQARPSALTAVVTTASGGTRTLPVTLADQPGPQRTDTGIGDVVRVRLVVRAATGLTEGRHIALGEVEFFRRP